ncbi:HK97 family phage prohead protease [Paraburkholderia aspalathi]|nr:HK97 family phage prohead protease [Paraburkholderia aspalathi]
MKTKVSAPIFDIKEISEDGVFSGYGSIFGNRDHGGDIVVAGAFAKSLAEHRQKGSRVKMFWQHDPHQPIGKWTELAEDGKGLFVEGKLNMGVQKGREAYALLKDGDIDGLSIGYSVIDGAADDKQGAFMLRQLKLWEVSVVSMAMNGDARVDAVKSEPFEKLEMLARHLRDGEPLPAKEFEDILREAGIPKSMATQIASVGYAKAVLGEPVGEKANQRALLYRALLRD